MKKHIVNRLAIFSILALVFALPSAAVAADLQITEIMYNPEGSDASYEWLEVHNISASSLDLEDWAFYEDDTAHVISSPDDFDDSLTLSADKRAVIARSPEDFTSRYSNSGLLTASSFSLVNSGETLALETPDGDVVGEITYDPSIGADDDGNSLQLTDGDWIAASPTPGEENSTDGSNDDADSSDDTNGSTDTAIEFLDSREEITPDWEDIDLEVGSDKEAIVGLPVDFTASIDGISDNRLADMDLVWSLGNGVLKEGKEATYTYTHPGEYLATFKLSDDEHTYTEGLTVDVVEADISIAEIDSSGEGYVALENDTDRAVDLSGWQLQAGDDHFEFPEPTIHLEDEQLVITNQVSGLSGDSVSLLFPDKTVVTSTSSYESASQEAEESQPSRSFVTYGAGEAADGRASATTTENSSEEDSSEATEVAGTSTQDTSTEASLAATAEAADNPASDGSRSGSADLFWQWAGLLIALLVAAVGTAILLRRVSKPADDPAVQAAKFDINEL